MLYTAAVLRSVELCSAVLFRIYLAFEYRSLCVIPRADSSSPELQEEATGVREARTGDKL